MQSKGNLAQNCPVSQLKAWHSPTHIFGMYKKYSSTLKLLPENYNSILPSIALSRVASSANSRFEPTGIP